MVSDDDFEGIGEAFPYDGQFVSDLEFIAKNVVALDGAAAYNKPTEELTNETAQISAAKKGENDERSISSSGSSISSSSNGSDSNNENEMSDVDSETEEVNVAVKDKRGKSKIAYDDGIELLDDEAVPSGPPRTKHEISELDAYQNNEEDSELTSMLLSSEDMSKLVSIGKISSTLLEDGVVVVKGDEGSNTVDEGSILFMMEGGKVLGRVREVFGPITAPFYVCPIIKTKMGGNGEGGSDTKGGQNGENGSSHDKHLQVGDVVSCLPSLEGTVFVSPAMLQELRAASRPTDASNLYDEEVDEGEAEYSDDEAERMARQAKKRERQDKNGKSKGKTGVFATNRTSRSSAGNGNTGANRHAQKPPPPANPPPAGDQGQNYPVPLYSNTMGNNYMHAQNIQAQMQMQAPNMQMGYPMQQHAIHMSGMPMMGYPQPPQGGQAGYTNMSPAMFMQQQQAPWPGFRGQSGMEGRQEKSKPVYKKKPI